MDNVVQIVGNASKILVHRRPIVRIVQMDLTSVMAAAVESACHSRSLTRTVSKKEGAQKVLLLRTEPVFIARIARENAMKVGAMVTVGAQRDITKLMGTLSKATAVVDASRLRMLNVATIVCLDDDRTYAARR